MKTLRLVVDGRPLVGNRTGIGVHTAEITRRLSIDPSPLIASHAPIADTTGLEHCRFDVRSAPLGVIWQQTMLNGVLRDRQAEVMWGPHGVLPWTPAVPAVISIHDLTSITMPQNHRLRTMVSFNLFITRSVEKAARIAAVSRVTADELMRGFGVPTARIEIVPNGVDEAYFQVSPERRGDFILYVGTLEPRKGIGELLTAWENLSAPRPRLVLAGDSGWLQGTLRRKLARLQTEGQAEVLGFVDRPRLIELYSTCLCFVYPSRWEGFGLPPLEAMACGAPTIVSDGGAIPEIVGDASEIFPAGDAAALEKALRRVLGNRGRREELISRGRDRAAGFRWSRSAGLMESLLVEAASTSALH